MNYYKVFVESLKRFLLPITGAIQAVKVALHQQVRDEDKVVVDTSR